MSKLEELIQQYCPDGVEYRPLVECCDILDGKRKPITKGARQPGPYPYYGANGIQDWVADYIFDGIYVLVGEDGSVITPSGTPVVNWAEGQIWVNNHAHILAEKSGVLLRFLFYYIQTIDIHDLVHGNIPKLTQGDLKELTIPIPPLPVQEEIVRVLDTFTELQAELQAELQKRLQQYNYYRDKLLSFEGRTDVEWKRLGDICKKVCSGGTPSRGNGDYFKGNIPWLRTQEVDWSDIYDTEIKITEGAVKKSSAKLIPENCVIVAMYGATAGKAAINKIPLTTNQACCNLQIDSNKALYKYVYYCVCNEYEHIKALGQGSQNNINAQIVKDYLIPVPPLAEQQRIVDILDRFDSLTNDLTAGLPAEIEKRRQQYEFYRDKLLTFKRKEA